MTKITALTPNTYKLKSRGHDMTLERTCDGSWKMTTYNASNMAYSNGLGSWRYFDSLQAVEDAYKSWAGIQEVSAQAVAADALGRIGEFARMGGVYWGRICS